MYLAVKNTTMTTLIDRVGEVTGVGTDRVGHLKIRDFFVPKKKIWRALEKSVKL